MAQPKSPSSVTPASSPTRQGCRTHKRVVLTRPDGRQNELAKRLSDAGFEVLELPALTITPMLPASDDHASKFQPGQFDVLVFVSRAAWYQYRQFYLGCSNGDRGLGALTQATQLADQRDDLTIYQAQPNQPNQPILACVGLGTAQQIAADLQLPLEHLTYPSGGLSSDSEGLWAVLRPKLRPGAKVLIVRGLTGRDWLADTLKDKGISVTCLSVYERAPTVWATEKVQMLNKWATSSPESASIDCNTGIWLITSAESLAAISVQYDAHGFTGKAGYQPQAVVVIHERLVPAVNAWLSHWQHLPEGGNHDPAPVFVTTPDDEAIFATMMAVIG